MKERYISNMSNNDSLMHLIFDFYYLADIDYNRPTFYLGGLIDVLADIDTTSLENNILDRIIDCRLTLNECRKAEEEDRVSKEDILVIDRLSEILFKIEIDTPGIMISNERSLKVKCQKGYTSEQKQIIYDFITGAKIIRKEMVGW